MRFHCASAHTAGEILRLHSTMPAPEASAGIMTYP
jgi:hypothetical protein